MKNVAIAMMALLAVPLATEAAALRVKAGGTGDGSSWSSPLGMIDAAMNAANPGDEIWVAARPLDPATGIDFYYESSTLTVGGVGMIPVKDGVSMYGGFNGTETSRDQRNATTNVTKVLLQFRYRALADLPTTIDGFTWINGQDICVLLGDDGSPGTCRLLTISNSVFKNAGYSPVAIYAWQAPFVCSATIKGNMFYPGSNPIYIPNGAPKVLNNYFTELGGTSREGITIGGGGVTPVPDSSGAVVANNVLWGMGVTVNNTGVLVANNTVMAGTIGSTANKFGIIAPGGTTIVNNIVTFYDTGIFASGPITAHHNLVYGNGPSGNYAGAAVPGVGDINSDPLVVNRANGDLHLTSASPAINAGDNSVVQPGWTDYDGHPRIRPTGGTVDIGAYEYAPVTPAAFYSLTPCRVADTRNPVGPYGGPALSANADRNFIITNQCGIPSTATAVAFNFTITQPTALGDLRTVPGSGTLPLVSTMNWRPGQTRAVNAIIPLGPAGDMVAHVDQGSGTVHLIIDVNGYFQ